MTTLFDMPISSLMSAPVATITASSSLAEAHQLLRDRGISCVVVTAEDRAVGVISRTDLLHAGRLEARARGDGQESFTPLLTFPEDRKVEEVYRHAIVSLPPSATLADAARVLVDQHIHRIFVQDGDELAGVLSTKDVLVAIREARIAAPIATAMSTPVFTIPVTAPLAQATDQLEKAHISGLCVVDESEWPVGTFTQTEAIAARDLPDSTPIEEVMSYAMLCLDVRTPLYRAAGYAHATRARRVLAVEGRHLKGVLTGIDFARVVCS